MRVLNPQPVSEHQLSTPLIEVISPTEILVTIGAASAVITTPNSAAGASIMRSRLSELGYDAMVFDTTPDETSE